MEAQKTKKIKASHRILSFLRNEREKGRESFIIHRSDQGMKEIDLKADSEFDKQMEKTKLSDGVLDEDEFEDLGKVYEQVKKYIELKHGCVFRPAQDEVRKFMEMLQAEKVKKSSKNTLNWFVNYKKVREDQLRSKIEKQHEKKRQRDQSITSSSMPPGYEVLELRPRDARLLAHFHTPYEKTPDSVNVNLRISQYNRNKVALTKGCQAIQKECVNALKSELAQSAKNEPIESFSTQGSYYPPSPSPERSRSKEERLPLRSEGIHKIRAQFSGNTKPLDLSSYNLAERTIIDNRQELSKSAFLGGDPQNERISGIYRERNRRESDHNISDRKNSEGEKGAKQSILKTTRSVSEGRNRGGLRNSKAVTEGDEWEGYLSQSRFERKSIISMVTGRPMKPYLQLSSLAEKIEKKGQERKLKERTRTHDDQSLKGMDEFKNYLFSTDLKQISSQHSNLVTYLNLNSPSSATPLISIENPAQNGGSPDNSGKTEAKAALVSLFGAANRTIGQINKIMKSQSIKVKDKNSQSQVGTPDAGRAHQFYAGGNAPTSIGSQRGRIASAHTPTRSSSVEKRSIRHEKSGEKSTIDSDKKSIPVEFFSINTRLGKFSKLFAKIKQLRSEPNIDGTLWEEMRQLDEDIRQCEDHDQKKVLRKKQDQLGRKQFNVLIERRYEEEEQRALKFEKLVKKTECLENKLIEQFEEVKRTKHRMNEEYKSLIETFKRDRSVTRSIRKRNYNIDGNFKSPKKSESPSQIGESEQKSKDIVIEGSLQDMRLKSEKERRAMLKKNAEVVEWYTASVNKLALLSSNDEDMTICYLVMDLFKLLLEDGVMPETHHIYHLLNYIESSKQLKYNQNSIYCFDLLFPLYEISAKDLTSFKKYTFEKSRKQQ